MRINMFSHSKTIKITELVVHSITTATSEENEKLYVITFFNTDKMAYISTDASNIRKVFEVHMMVEVDSEGSSEDEAVYDEELCCEESISPDVT